MQTMNDVEPKMSLELKDLAKTTRVFVEQMQPALRDAARRCEALTAAVAQNEGLRAIGLVVDEAARQMAHWAESSGLLRTIQEASEQVARWAPEIECALADLDSLSRPSFVIPSVYFVPPVEVPRHEDGPPLRQPRRIGFRT